MTDKRVEVTVASLPGYENLVAEMYIDGKFVGLVSQESYPRMILDLQLYAPLSTDLEIFESALSEAKQRLWKLRKVDDNN